jgi:hypothetical protein
MSTPQRPRPLVCSAAAIVDPEGNLIKILTTGQWREPGVSKIDDDRLKNWDQLQQAIIEAARSNKTSTVDYSLKINDNEWITRCAVVKKHKNGALLKIYKASVNKYSGEGNTR